MLKPLKAAIAAAVLLVLFMSAQATAALWRAEETINVGAVSTGSLNMHAGNGTTSQQDYEFNELDGSNLVPGEFVQAPLTITNAGTTDLEYNLTGASALPDSPTPADVALADSSVLTIGTDRSAEECSMGTEQVAPLFQGPASSGATLGDARRLVASGDGASFEVLCVRVEVAADAPQSAAGGQMRLVLNFTGQQR
ncbi:hypothetical protein OK351_08205 [Glutamicibacter sp. MNS18]|uniref:hypothetical protein n=1 Tax=Glutamicibacter sp. MNS18 TaxID=2989817 RepID=UPI0022365D61|nr:hypothetical protein [Glutamicibacter sp. MNS18]MCW4465483.1 hypothetical protein [Glutamicibacter sp. MNS18]